MLFSVSFTLYLKSSKSEVGELQSVGQLCPTTCFYMAEELRMVLHFKMVGKKSKQDYFMPLNENYTKFKL